MLGQDPISRDRHHRTRYAVPGAHRVAGPDKPVLVASLQLPTSGRNECTVVLVRLLQQAPPIMNTSVATRTQPPYWPTAEFLLLAGLGP